MGDAGGVASRSYSYLDASGDRITVSTRTDGSTVTECSNGTTTVHNPDGSSRSVNNPLGGAAVTVEKLPNGDQTTHYPDGSSETLHPSGWITYVSTDSTSVDILPHSGIYDDDENFWQEHPVIRVGSSGQPTTGATLDGAVAQGHIKDPVVISTGQNVGTVAVVEFTSNGSIPFVYLPASVLTPDNPAANQLLETRPTVIDTSTPGPVRADVSGTCRQDPFKPPADAGDIGVSLKPHTPGDLTPSIHHIVDGVVAAGLVPHDLVGTAEDTAQALTQVTTWLYHGATPDEVVAFLIPRFPPSMPASAKLQTATQLTHWGKRLVDKTNNLGKQRTAKAPEVPPMFSPVSDTDAQWAPGPVPKAAPTPPGTTTAEKPKQQEPQPPTPTGPVSGPSDSPKTAEKPPDPQVVPPAKGVVTQQPDGSTITTYPDGRTVTVSPDGSKVELSAPYTLAGSTISKSHHWKVDHWLDGTTVTVEWGETSEVQNGTTEKRVTKHAWRRTTTYPDDHRTVTEQENLPGHSITRYPDGREILKYPDDVTITMYPNGNTVTEYPGGKVATSFPDGKTLTEYPDGSKAMYTPGPPGSGGKTVVEPSSFNDATRAHPDAEWGRVDTGPPSPNPAAGSGVQLDTSHYDDGHAFGWKRRNPNPPAGLEGPKPKP